MANQQPPRSFFRLNFFREQPPPPRAAAPRPIQQPVVRPQVPLSRPLGPQQAPPAAPQQAGGKKEAPVRPAAAQGPTLTAQPRGAGAPFQAPIQRSSVAPMGPSAPAPRLLPASVVTSAPPSASSPPAPTPRSPTEPGPSRAVSIASSSLPTSPNSPAAKTESPSRSPPPAALPTSTPTGNTSKQENTPIPSLKTVKPSSETALQFPEVARFKIGSNQEAQISSKVEQKNVLVQDIPDKPQAIPSNHNGHKPNVLEATNINMGLNGKGKHTHNMHSDSDKFGTRLVLAGVNKGATMELSSSGNKGRSNGWGKGKKLGTDQEEAKPNIKEESLKAMPTQSPMRTAFVNSNVQGVNNSVFYSSSCTHKDPGVHLSFSRKANKVRSEDIHLKGAAHMRDQIRD